MAALCLLSNRNALAIDWKPVDPAELAQKTPRVDPNADAEAIFWDIKIEDHLSEGGELTLTLVHDVRIKIFTELGKTRYSTVEIPQYGKRSITDVAGRTVKPDGTIILLKKDSIFDRELIKTKGLKVRGKSFTLPNVEVGDIIEYRYREIRHDEIASHMRLYFQRELPMWTVTYHLKPLQIPYLPFAMRSMSFRCKSEPFKKEPNGYYATSMTNVPAFQEEPYMPPEDELRSWMLIYYEEDKKIDPDQYWKEIGKGDFNRFKPLMNADGLVKRTAAELVSGADKPEDKLAAIESFCRTKIRNLGSGAFRMTAEERKAIKPNHSPGDTLKQKAGWGLDVNLLFASLANAAGFDARMARVADRGDTFFSKHRTTTYFLGSFSVAVKMGDQWFFADPATPYLERGMLRWQEEGGGALVSDPKGGFFTATQYSAPSRSVRLRRGKFKLLEDGSLEGSVLYAYYGHVARERKIYYEDMTSEQQEKDWKESLQSRLSTAEMSAFDVKNLTDPTKAVVVEHKVTVPGYATRTGKRILLQPAFFQHNVKPRFTEAQRKRDLYFEYGWAEDDEVVIELPAGWELDQASAPQSTKLGELGGYAVSLGKTTDGKTLVYRRKFEWGKDNKNLVPVEFYPQIKKAFDYIQEQDNHTVVLKAAGDGR